MVSVLPGYKDTYYLSCINTSPSYVLLFCKELFHSRKFTGEVITSNYIIEIISCRSYRAKQNNNNNQQQQVQQQQPWELAGLTTPVHYIILHVHASKV